MSSSTQRVALMAFVEAAVDGVVAPEAVNWGRQDLPVKGAPWCSIVHLAKAADGIPEPLPRADGALVVRVQREETWEIQVGSSPGDTPSAAAEATEILALVELRLYDDAATWPMRDAGFVPLRVGNVIDISRTARGSQWETVASLTVVFRSTQILEDETATTIDTHDIVGTLDPGGVTVGGTIPE